MIVVNNARKATELALDFLKQYYFFTKPLKANRQNTTWIVDIDVGLLQTQIYTVKINANDGSIINYEKK
jgi:hypothetical protein